MEFVTTDILSSAPSYRFYPRNRICANRPQQKLQLEAYYREQTNDAIDNRINDSSNCAHRIIYFKLFELHRGFYLLF